MEIKEIIDKRNANKLDFIGGDTFHPTQIWKDKETGKVYKIVFECKIAEVYKIPDCKGYLDCMEAGKI